MNTIGLSFSSKEWLDNKEVPIVLERSLKVHQGSAICKRDTLSVAGPPN
jgi:hypothetical protein